MQTPLADEQQILSVGDALRGAVAAVIMALTGQVLIAVAGFVLLVGLRRGMPEDASMSRVLVASLLPYVVVLASVLTSAVRGIGAVTTVQQRGASVMQSTAAAGDIRLIPYKSANTERRIYPAAGEHGVYEGDLTEFIEQLGVRGKTWRSWQQKRFDSGRVCDYETWRACCDILTEHGILQNEKRRGKGMLTTTNAGRILGVLGLSDAPIKANGRASVD